MSEATVPETAGGASPARTEPHHLRRAVILWVVLSLLGIAVWLVIAQFILPPEITDAGGFDNTTIVVFTILAIPVSMFVWVFLGYSLFAFRTQGRPTEDGIHLLPRPGIQIGWLGATSILCLFLVVWGMFGLYQETSAASPETMIVQVTGQQWLWTFYYPKYQVSSPGQVLELPVGVPVQFEVTSKDVLHGFAIQALGVRVDANPGQTTTTPVVTPTQIGDYQVVCVELCGLYHTFMWSSVRVVSQSDFDTWIAGLGGQSS
jgi:cytochrome c oxidase subunit II